ncbi:MAG: hypothetical protein QXT42_06775 [Thermoplasmata archaeon]
MTPTTEQQVSDYEKELREKIVLLEEMEETPGWAVLSKHIQGCIDAAQGFLARGAAQDYAEYRYHVGRIAALQDILAYRLRLSDMIGPRR